MAASLPAAAFLGRAEDGERSERALRGLQEAKTRVEQVAQEDGQAPDLFDRLATPAEPQNYYLEPYATQWCPQLVKKGAVVPLPTAVAAALDEARALSLSGLLPAMDVAWTSVDARLFLWSYKHRGRFAVFELDQPVVAVALCASPAPGVFTDKVRHVLVVATTVEVLLVAVLYDAPDAPIKLQRTKLSVSTDNCVVRCIRTTRSGRVFFGGSDGIVYELVYAPEQQAASTSGNFASALLLLGGHKACRKIAHTSSYANYLPGFLSGLASAPGKLTDIVVDNARHILYALHENAQVTVVDLGPSGTTTNVVCSLNLLGEGAKYAREYRRTRVSCPDERIFQSTGLQVVSLAVVPRDESSFVTLVAVTSTGIRLYLTVYSRRAYSMGSGSSMRAKRPTRLELVYIRLPPPAVSLSDAPPYHAKEGMQPGFAPGKSPSAVHAAFHRKGVFLLVDGRKDQQDKLVGIAHDPIAASSSLPLTTPTRKATTRESVSIDTCIGKVVDIQELDPYSSDDNISRALTSSSSGSRAGSKRSFEEMSSGAIGSGDSADVAIVNEMTLQYSQPSRHFLCLTNSGIQVFKKVRPVDQLHRILLLSRGSDVKAALAPFVRSFGEVQVSCMLIGLACGVSSDPLTNETTTTASVLRASPGIKSDEYIYATAMQGIFEIGQGALATAPAPAVPTPSETAGSSYDSVSGSSAPASTRIVLTTEFVMSSQHDGLVMFLSRLLRPLWTSKSIGARVAVNGRSAAKTSGDAKPSTAANAVKYINIHSTEKLDEVREILFQLRQLMESAGPYAVAITTGAALENNPSLINANGDTNGDDGITRVSELAMRYHKSRTEEQRQREMRYKAEQRSLYYLYSMVLRCIEAISLLRLASEYQVPLVEPLARMTFSDFVSTNDGATAAKSMIKALMQGRNENNTFLTKQLREQCPSYFSVADLWHYQGYKSLAMAKLGAPSARKAFLKQSLDQFLNSCHMWDSEDGVDVLQGICDDYALLNFYEGLVKLALACGKHFHDAAASDLSGIKLTWKRNSYGCILLALQRLLGSNGATSTANDASARPSRSPQAVDDMLSVDDETRDKCVEEIFHFALASEDEDFHELLYTWLLENGHGTLLTSIRSPFIESFLKAKDQDLLIKMYMDQRKYLVAAKVWWTRAHEDSGDDGFGASGGLESNPDLVKRQYYVSKALGCLKSLEEAGEAADAIREVRDVLDVLQLQVRVLKALEQQTAELEASAASSSSLTTDEEIRDRQDDVKLLTFKIFDASTLYNQFASKYDMWAECLHIIQVCKSEEADVVALLWRKIIFSIVPPSSSSAEFNAWRADQCELAGLSAQFNGSASFENGVWLGQLQSKILRLGKTLCYEGSDEHRGSTAATAIGASVFVFPVGFLAKQLELVSSWYLRVSRVGSYATTPMFSSTDATTFNWVLKLFLDVGVPHRVVLSFYEQLYREHGSITWTIHVLQSVLALVMLWKKHAISPRAGKDLLAEFAACCPHVVDLADDVITDLKAIPLGALAMFAHLHPTTAKLTDRSIALQMNSQKPPLCWISIGASRPICSISAT